MRKNVGCCDLSINFQVEHVTPNRERLLYADQKSNCLSGRYSAGAVFRSNATVLH